MPNDQISAKITNPAVRAQCGAAGAPLVMENLIDSILRPGHRPITELAVMIGAEA
jgi:hypothetical protein